MTHLAHASDDLLPELASQSFPSFLDQLAHVAWCVDSDGQCRWAGPHWELSTGLSAAASLGLGWLDTVKADDRPALLSALATVVHATPFDVDLRLNHVPDGRHRWYRTRVVRLQNGSNTRILFLCLASDIDELRRPHDAQAKAIAALQHRMRGTFGVIRSIIRRTARFSDSVETFAGRLDSRVGALARAQASVIRAPTAGIDLMQLVTDELATCAPNEATSVVIDGPPLRLSPRTAENLALALHELATNALQHGALSESQGHIDIRWSTTPDGMFEFHWRESGATHPVTDPGHRGYGREMLETALAYELQAETQLRFEPGGLCVLVRMPAKGSVLDTGAEPSRAA